TYLRFRALLFARVEHEGDSLASASFEERGAPVDRDAAAVSPYYLALGRLSGRGRQEFRYCPVLGFAPVGRYQIGPADLPRHQLVTAVLHQPEKGVIRVDNRAVEIPDADAHDIGVDQASNPGFAMGPIVVKPRILERDRRLSREDLQHGDSLGR